MLSDTSRAVGIPSELYGNGNTVRASAVVVLRRIIYNGSQKQTDGDSELIGANNTLFTVSVYSLWLSNVEHSYTTNPLGCRFGLIQRN
jgi:hypothetical protein